MVKMNERRKDVQELFHTRANRALNINLCVKFVKPFFLRGIQEVKTVLFYKSNRVRLMHRWFIHNVMEHCTVTR